MGKRQSLGGDAAAGGNPRKRQRIVHHEAPTSEKIHASRQLQQLLTFDQDTGKARHGLQSFKLFLEELLSEDKTTTDHETRCRILREYLESTRPGSEEEEKNAAYLPDIMQTWSHAGQLNNDQVMSAVPAVLALLLRLLSQSLDLVLFGLGVCRALLQKKQLDLMARNLCTDKGKSFIISPTLRLLREAICFDGGAVAKPFFRARTFTLKALARNLGIAHVGVGEIAVDEDKKRPSTRTNAVRFFLSALKFLHPEAKKELLSQKDVIAGLMRGIKQDPPYLVIEILEGLRDLVIQDDKVPREAKASLLNSSTLARVASLYSYPSLSDEDSDHLPSIPDLAHSFLMTACTSPSCGVLKFDSGFYPRDVDPDAAVPGAELDDLGLESIVWMNRFKNDVPVRNYVLSTFLQDLRPWSNVKQSELVIAIFKVAPELVAHFFITNKSFSFEPKLSATWIGYAAFLFQTATLPLPDCFCRAPNYPLLPPPTSIVVDNILPLPLNQKALARCLAHKGSMISFFATRILVVALQKLDLAVKMYHDPSHANKTLWGEAARRLADEFCQRSPNIQEMINSYRSIPGQDLLHREAASRLLRLYYEVIPQVALMAKFDVSPFLETALKRLSEKSEQEEGDARDHALSLMELENLLAIAGYSPGMRWFSVAENLALSPFTSLLKVFVEAPHGVVLSKVREVLDFVAKEQQLAPTRPGNPGMVPLLECLQYVRSTDASYMPHIWPFLDNCLTRLATAPIKYLESMQNMAQQATSSKKRGPQEKAIVSPMAVVMAEQTPFAIKGADGVVLGALSAFLPVFLDFSETAGESRKVLDTIRESINGHFDDKKARHKRVKRPYQFNSLPSNEKTTDGETEERTSNSRGKTKSEVPMINDDQLQETLHVEDGLAADNSALMKWPSKTADELVDDGYAMSLVSLLVSEHASIRREALVNILKMAAKLKASDYEEKEQIWLLLSEISESASKAGHDIGQGPLPSQVVAFACHAIKVLRDPLNPLYPKVNTFLTRGPVWDLNKVPLVNEVLSEEPSVDDSYYAQISWLLAYMIDALRTPADLALFHKKRLHGGPLLERLLALASNPYMRNPLKMQILRLLYRATTIEGGSTTLITRFGIVSWLEAQGASYAQDSEEAGIHMALLRRIWSTCDQQRVSAWSRQGIEGVINGDGLS
ncbi:nucleolar pre-ribosomal-associated protein 1 [Diplogelasinospora grovesii]|uniref:Nucleolar pre-ribosomal-associated protein 1 n=1 Tax=Diplogelasinospora grovesii TaxID=303347 RepID=A0AAN6N116_9PEZI|nr:nucleolar pre-ribosomal-associated protein 1 [Diplogelasinospora grovesii]